MGERRAIFIGIDDTDTPESPGTNQLARRLADALPAGFSFVVALRHQLLFDPRVPYTSKNGCASILVRSDPARATDELIPLLRHEMRAWYVAGSDPGLCVASHVPETIAAFARRAQRELVRQDEARSLAREAGVHLEGLGGTEDGVIGALAAVGLLATGEDGRVVNRPGWSWPDAFGGIQAITAVRARGVDEVRDVTTGSPVDSGAIDIGAHLRPSFREGRIVLYVERMDPRTGARWRAVKLP